MANATSALRMSGMNSGLDTEAIVNAMTATTKNKINTNERKVLKLQAQQEAYRTLIDSFTKFKDKYCDILNGTTSLKSNGLFNSFKSTLTNSAGTNVNGVKVTSSVNASTGIYRVKVNKVATQATIKSNSGSGKAVDLSNCLVAGKSYAMDVSVNGKTAHIVFDGALDEATLRDNINKELEEAFGKTNDGKGLVTIGTDNKLVSSDRSKVVTTNATLYDQKRVLDSSVNVNDMKTGTNTFKVTIGDTVKTVTFSTIDKDYFKDIVDADGKLKAEADIDPKDADKVKLFKEIAENQREVVVYDKFKEWEATLSDDDKKAFAQQTATAAKQKELDTAYDDFRASAKRAALEEAYKNDNTIIKDKDDPNYVSLDKYIEDTPLTETDVDAYLANSENGQKLQSAYDAKVEKIEKGYEEATQKAIETEQKAAYQAKFNEAKQAAYDAAVANGEFSSDEGDPNYKPIKDFEYTEETFKTTSQYTDYETEAQNIKDSYNGKSTFDYDSASESTRMALYDEYVYMKNGGISVEDFTADYTAESAIRDFNTANIENNLGALSFAGGIYGIEAKVDDSGNITIEGKSNLPNVDPPRFSITQGAGNATDFGLDVTDTSGTASQIDTTSKLSELGLTPDSEGNYSFKINDHQFSFSGDTTVYDMMREVNASEAGVKMSYTTLTNQFSITANEYGANATISIKDGSEGLLNALGFDDQNYTVEPGQNTQLVINGVAVETTSNSYTVDGTTFTFSEIAEGTEFTNEVTRDYQKPINAIKSFVEDYNKLIDEVYGYVDDEPNKDYYFLTDDDLEDMDLSESQQAKWEKLANKGILYRDSTLTNIMSKLRTIIYNTVDAADGTKVGLYTLGITTTSNWSDHGKLQLNPDISDEEFETIFAKYADEFCELFTDTEKGIAYQFEDVINGAVKTSGGPGERGTLVDKAGVSGTASATNNSIFNQISSLKNTIKNLQKRYDQQQDRYWKIYSNMETLLGSINGQSSYINQLMGM